MSYEHSKTIAALQLKLVEELRADNQRLREQLTEQRLAYAQIELERERLQEQVDAMQAPPQAVLPVAPALANVTLTEFQLQSLAALVSHAIVRQPITLGVSRVEASPAPTASSADQTGESHAARMPVCDF